MPFTWLFRPAIKLTNRLKYPQKFGLISGIFLVPLVSVTGIFLHEIQQQKHFTYQELSGLTYLRLTTQLWEELSELQLMDAEQQQLTLSPDRHRYNGGEHKPHYQAKAIQSHIQQIATTWQKLRDLNQQKKLIQQPSFGILEAQFKGLEAGDALEGDSAESPSQWRQRTYGQLLEQVYLLKTDIANESNLILDPELETYHLMDATVRLFPNIQRQLQTVQLLHAENHQNIPEVSAKIAIAANSIETTPREFSRAFQAISQNKLHNRDLSLIHYRKKQFEQAIAKFSEVVALQKQSKSPITMHQYAEQANAVTRTGIVLNREILNTLEAALHARHHRLSVRQQGMLLFALGLVLIAAYLFGGIYLSIMQTIWRLRLTSRLMTSGMTEHLASLDSQDEMTEVINAFNRVAKALVASSDEAIVLNLQLEHEKIELQTEQSRSEGLLLNVLPAPIVERLKQTADQPQAIADQFDCVTILFADLVGFTPLASQLPPRKLVDLLNQIFTEFDRLSQELGLEKIKTIGDAYMVAAGLPLPRPDHADAIARMALEMQQVIRRIVPPLGKPLELRIGIHTGSVVAGVIGTHKFIYDLWGDTVNVASRMEASGRNGCIQVSQVTYEHIQHSQRLLPRGDIMVKGKGMMKTYWLVDDHVNLNQLEQGFDFDLAVSALMMK
jgi:class 3 adenylate cyclase